MLIRGTLIPADGGPLAMFVCDRVDALTPLQRAVGGYIERFEVGSGLVMYMNEDGRAQGPRNQRAIDLVEIVLAVGHVQIEIVGDVIVFSDGQDVA